MSYDAPLHGFCAAALSLGLAVILFAIAVAP